MPRLHYRNEANITRPVARDGRPTIAAQALLPRPCAVGPDRDRVALDARLRALTPSAQGRPLVVTR